MLNKHLANKNKTKRIKIFIYLSALLITTPCFAAENAGKIMKKVKSTYERLESFSTEFEKIYTWTMAAEGETQTLRGRLYLKKDDRYRIETKLQTIVTNGKTVWIHSTDKQQVFVDDLKKSKENPLPRDLLIKYSNDFKPTYLRQEKLGQSNCHVIRLLPRDNDSFVESVTVWIDKKNWIAIQTKQIDINDNVTLYRLSNLDLKKVLPDQLFNFSIPKETEVIDLR